MMNVLNGGSHADNNLDIQEFMIIPIGADLPRRAAHGRRDLPPAEAVLKKRGLATAVGDEGGFAPNLGSNEEAFDLLLEAIVKAHYKPGATSCSASTWRRASSSTKREGCLPARGRGEPQPRRRGMVDYLGDLVEQYPIVTIEDGLDENDWDGWAPS
jgi:enolase